MNSTTHRHREGSVFAHLRAIASALLVTIALPAMGQEQAPENLDQTQAPEINIVLPESDAPPVDDDPLLDRINQELAGGDEIVADPAAQSGERPAAAITTEDVLRWFTVLLFVVALIIITGFVLRKLGTKTPMLAGGHLARVIGRVHLARGATLYYVHTGGRVLILGVTGDAISLVGEFDAAAFDLEDEAVSEGVMDAESFLRELQKSSRAMSAQQRAAAGGDDEINSLRNDVSRLQAYLQEESRERKG